MKKINIKQKAQAAFILDIVAIAVTLFLFAHTANTIYMFLLSIILIGIGLDAFEAYKFLKRLKWGD